MSHSIVVSQSYPCSAGRLWQAITLPDQMRAWFFDTIPDFRAEPGFEVVFDVQAETAVFRHRWKVEEAGNFDLLLGWTYDGHPGCSQVLFKIEESPHGGSTLTLEHNVTVPFPSDIPEFKPESCRAGWTYFLCEKLLGFIQKG